VVALEDYLFIFQYGFASPPRTVFVVKLKVLEQDELFGFSERVKIYPNAL
jgi:hypothetical protein